MPNNTTVDELQKYLDSGDLYVLPHGCTDIRGKSGNDAFWSAGMAIKPVDLKSLESTIREDERKKISEQYGDFRAVGDKKRLGGYGLGRTLRFFLLSHTEHKPGDDENL
jgi:hypothetical protein